ncbi:MAG: GNAT family N-acetyltransferase [Spirochaetaceae bacterium]|nr:MAG: GNAT family N-acetyltransferase [Spirochaetaceae bacterium]
MTRTEDIRIVSPDPECDRSAIIDLTGKTFGDSYFDWVERCEHGYLDNSPYDWQASRVAFVGDRLVGHFGVYDITQRIGCGTLRVAGIGAVACDAEFRKRGIVRAVAADSVAGLAGAGYEVSLLYGIRNFYHRFGYVTAWPDYRWTVSACDLPDQNAPATSTVSDYVALASLANAWNDGIPGTAIRPTYRDNPRTSHRGYQWQDASGAVSGYIVCHKSDDALLVTDAAGDPEAVLAACRAEASRQCCARVSFIAFPPASPYVRALQKRPYTLTAVAEPDGGPMIRSVSLASALRSLAGELASRLASVGYPAPVSLVLEDGREQALISFDPGAVGGESVRITSAGSAATRGVPETIDGAPVLYAGDSAARMLYGTHTVDALHADGLVTGTAAALQAARLFFPVCSPSLTAFDTM